MLASKCYNHVRYSPVSSNEKKMRMSDMEKGHAGTLFKTRRAVAYASTQYARRCMNSVTRGEGAYGCEYNGVVA